MLHFYRLLSVGFLSFIVVIVSVAIMQTASVDIFIGIMASINPPISLLLAAVGAIFIFVPSLIILVDILGIIVVHVPGLQWPLQFSAWQWHSSFPSLYIKQTAAVVGFSTAAAPHICVIVLLAICFQMQTLDPSHFVDFLPSTKQFNEYTRNR